MARLSRRVIQPRRHVFRPDPSLPPAAAVDGRNRGNARGPAHHPFCRRRRRRVDDSCECGTRKRRTRIAPPPPPSVAIASVTVLWEIRFLIVKNRSSWESKRKQIEIRGDKNILIIVFLTISASVVVSVCVCVWYNNRTTILSAALERARLRHTKYLSSLDHYRVRYFYV